MKKFLIFLFCFAIAGSLQAGNFQNFLDRVHSLPDSLRPAVVDSFMNSVPGFPYVEQDSLVHYIFRGNASSVTIPGDANNWDPAGFAMKRIEGTDLWFCTRVFEPDARLDYKFVLNGQYWILDPLNPRRIPGGMGTNSELRMPGYRQSSTTAYYADIPHGTITDTLFHSKYLGDSRNIRIYLPPQYQTSQDSFGLVLFHDGPDYISLAGADNTLDYLIWKKRIRPVIALFVPPVNRRGEYAGALQPQFEDFIVKELLPWFDSAYRTRKDPSWRATIGASNGGNIALYLAVAHPRLFGKVGVQSSNVQPSIL
ncbi:MAG: alpha/beta hydrolase-fold protein, partial [Calditrichia bacterium]